MQPKSKTSCRALISAANAAVHQKEKRWGGETHLFLDYPLRQIQPKQRIWLQIFPAAILNLGGAPLWFNAITAAARRPFKSLP